MTSFVNGKVAKLRASCDACNESKVRCSQAKPKCARCKKQGVACIYGLSRRSHRSAPRIGESSQSVSSPSDSASNTQTDISNLSIESQDSTSVATEPATAMQEDMPPGTNGSTSFLSSTNFLSDLDSFCQDDSMDPSSSALDSTMSSMTDMSTEAYDFSSLSSPDLVCDNTQGDLPAFGMHDHYQIPNPLTCDCMSRVIKQLLSIPNSFGDDDASFDAHLSQLKCTIIVLDNCICCSCMSYEEVSIMTVSILIGRVLQGFESMLAKASSYGCFSQPSDILDSPGGEASNSAPRLSWGVLQIDRYEEDELKQHLWRLQFPKLMKVFRLFNVSASRLITARGKGTGNPAHAITYHGIHMWLLQKVDAVRNGYLGHDGTVARPKLEAQNERPLV